MLQLFLFGENDRFGVVFFYHHRASAFAMQPLSCYNRSMDYKDVITLEPGKRGGQATIRGMRITVQDILKMLASDMTHDEIIVDYPELTRDDIRAALWYASRKEQTFRHFA